MDLLRTVNLKTMDKSNFNKREIRKIWKLSEKTRLEEKVDVSSDEFLDCEKILLGRKIKLEEKDLLGIIKEIKNKKITRLIDEKILEILDRFLNYSEVRDKKRSYFCPIYNLDSNIGEMDIDEQIKIRKIKSWELKYLKELYKNFRPIRVQIAKIEHVLIITVSSNTNITAVDDARDLREKVLNQFRLCRTGDIKFGGLYEYEYDSNWNPDRIVHRIEYDKVGAFSIKKFHLSKRELKRFVTLITQIDKRHDMFYTVIRRFSETRDKKHDSDKITDYVMCMEALLVNSQNEVSYQFALYAALLNGGNEKMRKKNNTKLRKYYSIRSKMVHELDFSENDKKTGPQNVTEIETFARIVILKMILISLEKKFEDLEYVQLVKKVEESIFDEELREKFDKLDSIIN
jgi:hypothetical protein